MVATRRIVGKWGNWQPGDSIAAATGQVVSTPADVEIEETSMTCVATA